MTAQPDALACLAILLVLCLIFAVGAPIADYFARRQHERARRGLDSEYGLFDRERLP